MCFSRLSSKFLILFVISFFLYSSTYAAKENWAKEKVDWRIGGGTRIRNIEYPTTKKPYVLEKGEKHRGAYRKKISPARGAESSAKQQGGVETSVMAAVIDAPPINGFAPWVAVSLTDARSSDDAELTAVAESTVVGNFFATNPATPYVIGLFDSGASAHVMGYNRATALNLGADFLSPSTTVISGVTGSVDASVSYPLGVFVASLEAIRPDGSLDGAKLIGQSNVSIAIGQEPVGVPDLATAIGSPMSVFYATAFHNDQQITVTHDGEEYTAPAIRVYEKDDPSVPAYSNSIPLELRPLGATSVQYVPTLDFETLAYYPQTPSIITGTGAQSLFFVASVDLVNGSKSAIDKTRFMFDTGAQISVVGSRVGARLGLDRAAADFYVDIEGVTGEVTQEPGFYIGSIEIPALGDWLTFTNVPVVLLDIPSPEGGTLDGIIGMNLFVGTNFVLRGGGFMLEDDPSIEYDLIASTLAGDIAPEGGDGTVNYLDLAAFAQCWMATPVSSNWNSSCDMAPAGGDQDIDFADYAILASEWLENLPSN